MKWSHKTSIRSSLYHDNPLCNILPVLNISDQEESSLSNTDLDFNFDIFTPGTSFFKMMILRDYALFV